MHIARDRIHIAVQKLWRSTRVHTVFAAQLCLLTLFAYTPSSAPIYADLIMAHLHADALFRPNLGISPLPPSPLLLSRPTTSLCERDTPSHHSIAVAINILRAATSAIIPILPESYTFPSVRRHPLGMSGNALSLRAGRPVTVVVSFRLHILQVTGSRRRAPFLLLTALHCS
jgi:hypothetical protein